MKLLGVIFLLFARAVFAADEPKDTAGKIEAATEDSRFEYDLKTKVWTGFNGVVVTYQDAILTADKVTWNEATGEAFAEGEVRIQREGHVFTGEKIRYNFKTKEITGGQFRTGQPPFFAVGQGLLIDQTNKTYIATNVFVTTDDTPNPRQGVRARQMKMVPGEYFELRHATFEVAGIPVFYLPFYRRNLGENQSHFNLVPGYRSRYGPFLLGAYEWYWQHKLKSVIHLDYRLKRGVGFGPDFQWDLGAWGDGEFRYYYADDDEPGQDLRGKDINNDRQRLYFSHQATLRSNLTAKAVVRYQSDPFIVRDFFEGEYRKNVQPTTFLELNQLWNNFSLDVLAMPRINDFYDTVERLPDIRLTGYRQQIGETPFYYESESSFGYYRHKFAYNQIDQFEAWRGDTYHQITLPHTFFGWLNVIPRVGGRFTYYGEADGPGAVTDEEKRGVFNTGAEVTYKAWKVYRNVHSSFFDLNEMRHIIQPSVNYAFVPHPTVSPRNLPQFDSELPSFRLLPIEYPDYNAIDSIDSQNVVRFLLRNRLQTKRLKGMTDFVDWSVYTDWRLRPEHGQRTYADLYSDLEFRPRSWLELSSEVRYGLNEEHFKELYDRLTILPGDNWSISLGNRYLRTDPVFGQGYNLWISSIYYRLNENYAFRMSHHFEARDGRMEEQYYTMYRDLRSWTAALTLRLRDHRSEPNDITVAFTFSIKAFPRFGVNDDTDKPALLLGY